MRHFGWFGLILIVAICFYRVNYELEISKAINEVILNTNDTYALVFKAQHKDIVDCMSTLPKDKRDAIYTKHRQEFYDKK